MDVWEAGFKLRKVLAGAQKRAGPRSGESAEASGRFKGLGAISCTSAAPGLAAARGRCVRRAGTDERSTTTACAARRAAAYDTPPPRRANAARRIKTV